MQDIIYASSIWDYYEHKITEEPIKITNTEFVFSFASNIDLVTFLEIDEFNTEFSEYKIWNYYYKVIETDEKALIISNICFSYCANIDIIQLKDDLIFKNQKILYHLQRSIKVTPGITPRIVSLTYDIDESSAQTILDYLVVHNEAITKNGKYYST
jgi:hypothetical protein